MRPGTPFPIPRRAATPWLAAALALAACAGESAPPGEPLPPAEIVEVDAAIDAEIDLSADPRGFRPVEGVSGMLPPDFPGDLPLITPASLVDFGAAGGGERFLVLQAEVGWREARAGQLGRARAGGWQVAGEGTRFRLTRGARSVRLELLDFGEISQLRFEYRPAARPAGG